MVINIFLAAIEIRCYKLYFFQTIHFILSKILNGFLFDEQSSFNTSATRGGHTTPVFERIGNKGISGDGGYGFIEILYLNRGQCDFSHIAIGTVFFKGYPVANTYHIVNGDLYAGHKT